MATNLFFLKTAPLINFLSCYLFIFYFFFISEQVDASSILQALLEPFLCLIAFSITQKKKREKKKASTKSFLNLCQNEMKVEHLKSPKKTTVEYILNRNNVKCFSFNYHSSPNLYMHHVFHMLKVIIL